MLRALLQLSITDDRVGGHGEAQMQTWLYEYSYKALYEYA